MFKTSPNTGKYILCTVKWLNKIILLQGHRENLDKNNTMVSQSGIFSSACKCVLKQPGVDVESCSWISCLYKSESLSPPEFGGFINKKTAWWRPKLSRYLLRRMLKIDHSLIHAVLLRLIVHPEKSVDQIYILSLL